MRTLLLSLMAILSTGAALAEINPPPTCKGHQKYKNNVAIQLELNEYNSEAYYKATITTDDPFYDNKPYYLPLPERLSHIPSKGITGPILASMGPSRTELGDWVLYKKETGSIVVLNLRFSAPNGSSLYWKEFYLECHRQHN